MVELLNENDWWLRAAAADVLGDLGTMASDTVPHLTRALDDEAEWVRRNAIEALGNIGPVAAAAVPALSHRLQDSESWIRHKRRTLAGQDRPSRRRSCACPTQKYRRRGPLRPRQCGRSP